MGNNKLFQEFPPISKSEWEEVITKDLKGADYDKKLVWHTIEGINVQPYYRAEDLESIAYLNTNPTEFPFVRGQKKDNNHWDIRCDIKNSELKKANTEAIEAIKRGATAVGLNAYEVKNNEDIKTLLNGIDLSEIKVHFTSAKSYLQLVKLFIEEINSQGIDKKKVAGSINYDMYAYALLNGGFWGSEDVNLEELIKITQLIDAEFANFRTITVKADIFHNAGANIVQELAFALSEGNEYMASLTERAIRPDNVATNLLFSFSTGSNYFMEIAKIRAFRLLWAKIVEQYQPMCDCAYRTYIHSTSSIWNKSLYDPYVNMLRTTTESMSSAIAGVDSISVAPFDVTYKSPNEFSSRIAQNQQILLKEESYLDKIVDPAAGSYYIENLTDSLVKHAWELFLSIESKGGFSKAIAEGFIQEEIGKTAQKRNMDIATRKTIILGTNQYPNPDEKMSVKIEKDIAYTCHDGEGPIQKLVLYRGTDAFDDLRIATEESGKNPKVFLFTYGNPVMRKARAVFATNFFGVAGYQIIDNLGFETIQEGIKASLESKAEMVVICSSDDEYPEIVPAIIQGLTGKVKNIVLAGYPQEHIEAFKKEGITEFIHARSNVLEVLHAFQKQLGILK